MVLMVLMVLIIRAGAGYGPDGAAGHSPDGSNQATKQNTIRPADGSGSGSIN